jgi:hypothetical protein
MSVLGPDSPLFQKEPSRRGQWLVHHPYAVPWLLFVIAPTQEIAYGFGGAWEWFAFVLSQVFVVAILFELWASLKHMRGFCEFCFHQPAGGPDVAQKHRRQLRVHHLRFDTNRWVYITVVLALYLPVIFLRHWPYVVYVVAFFFLFGFFDKASQTHAWLVPWCPWCKDDGRWTEPSPVPDPSMTKQRV